MNAIKRPMRALDRFQQRHPVLAFPVAVWAKFHQDRAGNLAALIAYYGFAALFPLLLLLVTVLNIALSNDPTLRDRLLNSALAQYPVVGQQIRDSLGTIGGTSVSLVIGIVLLLLAARAAAAAMQNALCEIWGVARAERPGFPMSQLWALLLIFTIGIGFIVTTFLSGIAYGAGHVLTSVGATVGAVAVSLVLNVGLFWLGFRIATMFQVRWHDLRVGAALAAVCWTILQQVGGYVISHQLHRASELYGTFGIVLGLLAWLYLQAEVTLYAAETDVVLARRLWPTSVMPDSDAQPPAVPEKEPVNQTDQANQPPQLPPPDRPEHARLGGPSSLEVRPRQHSEAAVVEPSVPSQRGRPAH